MNWTTIYISGNPGFEKELQRKLERSDLPVMSGSSGLSSGPWLCWIDEQLPIRKLKEAIGADLIWRYRLQFSMSIEETDSGQHDPFTEREENMIETMKAHVKRRAVSELQS